MRNQRKENKRMNGIHPTMLFSIVSKTFRRFLPKEKLTLGRWTIEACPVKMDHKIDLSNEDHCGPCGQYVLTKTRDVPPSASPRERQGT